MPKVSVIIPTYNRAELLKKSIASVLTQTFKDFELLIVDDCSTDETSEVVKGNIDNRIKYIKNKSNKGIAAVRNIGINNSEGECIAFLDDDDEWLPEKLERQMKILETSSPHLGCVYTGGMSVKAENSSQIEMIIPRYRGKILERILLNNFIITSSIMFKKACIEEVGLFDENINYAEDYDMWIRISKIFEFDYVKEPLVICRIHQNRISSNKAGVARGLASLMTKHRELFSRNKKAYCNFHLLLGVAYCYNGNMKEGRKAFIKAIKSSPFDKRPYYNIMISLLGSNFFISAKEVKSAMFSTDSK